MHREKFKTDRSYHIHLRLNQINHQMETNGAFPISTSSTYRSDQNGILFRTPYISPNGRIENGFHCSISLNNQLYIFLVKYKSTFGVKLMKQSTVV